MLLDITLEKHKTVNGYGVYCLIQYAREARRFLMGTYKGILKIVNDG